MAWQNTMAASSGGVDWTSVLKPFLSKNYETSNTAELIELCSAIVKSESEILRHKESNKNFFNSIAVLASDYISSSTSGLLTSQLETVNAACRVLLKYLLSALNAACSEPNQSSAQIERYLNAIKVLCIGTRLLSTTEVTILVDSMKGENLPQQNPVPSGNERDVSNKQESSKHRSDLSVSIYEQLTLPLRDGRTASQDIGASGSSTAPELTSGSDPSSEINRLFLKANTESLQALRAGDTLIDLCLSLPSIKKAKGKVEDALAGKPFCIPTNHTEATALRNSLSSTLSDINLAMSALNLPVLEPLTSSKLDKLCSLAMAVLHCALSQAAAAAVLSMGSVVSPKCSNQQSQAGLKEDDLDSNAVALVEETLNMYNFIGNVIKTSTRAGGHVYQNYLLAGAWVLISGLQTHLSSSTSVEKTTHLRERDEKGRSPCKTREGITARSGLQKFQQSFGVLSVALASRALSLLSELFDDLYLEVCGGAGSIVQVEPAPLAIMGQFTALQRVSRILNAAPLNHLLFYLAIVSYRKACTLKRLHPPEGDTFSQSDSTTYYEDMIMCSDDSSTDEDDDSEPILGQWFEETLAPPETTETKSPSSENVETKTVQNERSRSMVPEKGEAHGFIALSTNVFVFLNKHFLSTKSTFISRYVKNGLTEQQMIILAAIIRDLDRETARTEIGKFQKTLLEIILLDSKSIVVEFLAYTFSGTISVYFGQALGQLYCEFSGALTRFAHNLVTNGNLSNLQACLLNHLGVSPWNTDVPHAWPLQVYPRTLAVLAQVLLLRPQNEKEASVISIWHRLVNTLIENVLNNAHSSLYDNETEDLNVEHAQVLLYLFHSLNLMQKKSVVLLMAGGVLRCSEIARGPLKDFQLLHLSRLLLLFDYIMKHLYDPPTSLLEQIQSNLFYLTNLNPDKEKDNTMTRMYTAWQDIEDHYRKVSGVDEFAMKPRFYVLTNLEVNNQDAPKLDGLACNFILGTPDKLKYPLLLDALIEILNVTHITSGTNTVKMSFLGLCATQYCFTICWRLLQLLPPSASYMERLATGESLTAGPLLLHSLVWGPRASHKNFSRWLKDCLVKQGMYTQHTDKLLKEVSDAVNNIKYDIMNVKNCIISLTPDVKKGLITKENLPPFWHLFLLDALMTKVQVALEEPEGSTESTSITVSDGTYVQDLLPYVLRLTQAILHCTRWSLLHTIVDQNPSCEKFFIQNFEGLQDVLAIASTKNSLTSSLSSELTSLLPSCVTPAQLQNYKSILEDFSLSSYQNDIIPTESAILKVIDAHISTLSMNNRYNVNFSLRRLLQCLVKFICDHAPKTENTDTKNKAIELLVSITLDLRTEYLNDSVTKTLDKMIGDTETDEHQKRIYLRVLDHTYRLIINYTSGNSSNYSANIDEKILHHCLKFYEKIIEKSSGRQALEIFFTGERDLVKVLMSVSSPQMSQHYGTRVLHFFNKLFQAAEKSSTDPSLNYLCSSMSKLANVDSEKLQTWLRQIILGTSTIEPTVTTTVTINKDESPATSSGGKWTITAVESKDATSPTSNDDQKSLVQENSQLLQALTTFIVKQTSNVSEEVSITILKALIELGKHLLSPSLEGSGFIDLMVDMILLANAGSGKGHSYLFPATAEWIELCNKRISEKEVVEKLMSDPDSMKNNTMLEASSCILDYVSDVVLTVTSQLPQLIRPLSPPWESESPLDLDSEWQDFVNEDDESGEDSDEDSLCNKLCTFTITQKEFMNQHWYHCHTCKMLDGVGVCSICARVCHKGHDLSYAKYGNFFCDCGAKEDGSCQALVKRSPMANDASNVAAGTSSEHMLTSSLRRRTSSPLPTDKFQILLKERKNSSTVKQMDGSKEFIINYLGSSKVTGSLLEFLQSLLPAIEENCRKTSLVGCHIRGTKALHQLYSCEKKFMHTDQLMVPTLGSQEGAFENVRMSYAGEQGQTIRQLLSAHIVRRIAMCCMTSTQGRRQHLAVSHEKGKITVLQLSALLKQADSSTRKLTLTRLSTAPIPFTVLSLSSNLCNEDFLAVCGLKDCHILTFTSGGSVSDHLVLHPQLETGNFIVKAIWLPGSQTKLALVTADFVKIYDLALDALSPQYFFLVPSGKIRDCTFMYEGGTYHILLMSSPGHIYKEILNEDSSTKYGSFYVTNTLDIFNLEAADVNGQVAGGGVSIYYSHTLGLLFYSYAQGKSFVSPMNPSSNSLPLVFPINLPQNNNSTSKSNGSKNSSAQPLCQWTEIPNHPGLICCAIQSNNNPVILMIKPDTIMIQEIRVVPAKSKIMDMVAIRHNSGNELRTTLILLCEDGSLKMYMANMDQTGFWMSPSIQATITNPTVKQKKKKVVKSGKTTNSLNFPVDFFEHCTVMNDVEIGGNDLLQIYNQAQLKHRLNTTGLYVACNKPVGFSIEVTNNDANIVMVGLRVLVGSQDVQRCPSFIEVFGRITPITPTRSRWYDIPFSREESLQADKKITILFGPSEDPETVTMVDSIKLYGKTKDSFGWPEENDENVPSTGTGNTQQVVTATEGEQNTSSRTQLTRLEKLVVSILESLDGNFSLHLTEDKLSKFKIPTLKVATSLLTLPTQPSIQIHTKALLSSLHSTRQLYHNYKDHALLQHVLTTLTEMTTSNVKDLDAESYYRLVLIVRGIAVARPQNLVKFADSHTSIQDVVLEDPLDNVKDKEGTPKEAKTTERKPQSQHLLIQLIDVLWYLHSSKPEIPSLSLVVAQGLKHTEQIVHALVEIVHAFNSSDTYSNITIAIYLQLLLCSDPLIAFSAKQALSVVLKPKAKRRKVFIPSPPHCVSPPPIQKNNEDRSKTQTTNQPPSSSSHEETVQHRQPNQYDVDSVEAISLLEQPGHQQDNVNPLEALLGGGVGFPPLLDIPPDADDEAMVELAIALSLQEHEIGGEQNQVNLQSLQVQLGQDVLVHQGQNAQAQEAANFSDTTASAAGSDDEGSTAATDGSTLRTSPAEQAGSESGGSGVESITGEHNVSGRSSAYGDNMQETINLVSRSDTSSIANTVGGMTETDAQQDEAEIETENSSRLHVLRLQLLEKLIDYLPKLKNVDGVRAIPFLQVVLQLTSDIDGHCERDRTCLNALLSTIINELQLTNDNFVDICTRTKQREVQLILLRLISVFMQRCKTSSTPSSSSSKTPATDNSTFVSRTTATALHKSDIINYCNKLLQSLLNYWKATSNEDDSNSVTGNLLKERLPHPPPDMTPFFQRQFVKDNQDVFQTYPQLLTEIALRLPYQVHRHSDISEPISSAFDVSWYNHLCDYMMTPQTPFVRRQVRKLLMFICGNKDTYRQLRDLHGLKNHMKRVMECCTKAGYQPTTDVQHALSLPYDSLVELIEHLKYCVEVAQSRTGNWQRFCIKEEDIIQFLMRVSFLLDDGVAPTILQLLQCALVVNSPTVKRTDVAKPTTSRKEREKSDDSSTEALFEESNSVLLVEQISKQVSREVFARFTKTFMLETNITSVRWQAHALIQAIYKNSLPKDQQSILELLWQLWPLLPVYGRKAAQFVDLLGYFSLKHTEVPEGAPLIPEYVERAFGVLKAQNEMLALHPNANLYAHMGQFVDLDGYYLESEPCLVCNNPEVPFTVIKLSSIKADSKFTTTTQIVKLLSSHTISKITIRIAELKRTKMVRTVNIYYNNRSVQAVVELKNKPALWHKAKKVTLQSGQTEVKIEFPLPIVACNLMVEYTDFYENIQASSETLQCPRCSASVPANPGVCANCGENVYQCHKCRAINYDEKDPFLCHACGFCKYAKFDFSLLAKPCCAVEPIENDEDRKKTVSSINSLLEKADRVYKQLIANKPTLEALVLRITEHRSDNKVEETSSSSSNNSTNSTAGANATSGPQLKVNKTIQMLAQQYCNDCKTSFEELSKIIQKVLVSRKELVTYDRKHRDMELPKSTPVLSEVLINSPCVNNRCYGCSTAATEHCLTLLRALAHNPTTRQVLCSQGLVQELVWNNLRNGSVHNQEEVRQLLCVLTKDNRTATEELCNLLMERISLSLNGHISSADIGTSVRHEIALLAAMVRKEDDCWELKLQCMMGLFLKACEDSKNPLVMESVILPCLKILQSLMKTPEINNNKKNKDKLNSVSSIQNMALSGETVDVRKFLEKDQEHTFNGWKSRFPKSPESSTIIKPSKDETRKYYLAEKYWRKWRRNSKKLYTSKTLNLHDTSWLKAVMFNSSSRLARQVACNIVEMMCSSFERKRDILDLLTNFLVQLSTAGESAAEFLAIYQNLIQEAPWKQYLTINGVLLMLAHLITVEIEQLHILEETTLTSDLAQGYALNQITELLSSFLDDAAIRRQYKGRLVGAVLNGYLSLRRLVVQRTRLIDDTQEKLLDLLEDMTTGTEEETKAFMSVCIKTVERYSLQDILTPVFIFERLCSIIYPEENDVGEFFLTLEKDPQQEDFLQGRMLGNPYCSLEAGLGPLMRDVKNKICQDCELVALLEDDNGMELLVNNKIMSLDLQVKDVYKKIWLAEGGDHEPMRIVYRMRGLLGDATEEFIENLNNKSQSDIDNEEVYKMANVLADCGGLQIMVTRLGAIQSVTRARPLLQVLLKLFRLCVKVNRCQEVLIQPQLKSMEVFLRTLQLCLNSDRDSSQTGVTEQLLDIMETILSKATSEPEEKFKEFSKTLGSADYVKSLLSCTNQQVIKSNSVLVHLTRVLAALVYGNKEKMKILLDHFSSVLDFNKYDSDHTPEDQQKLEMFCVLTNSIEKNAIGNTLKDYIISLDVVKNAVEYITKHAPCVKPTLLRVDSDELKDFISKPALKYILRFLTGLAHSHEKTQLAVAAAETIPIIHRLEQVSSDEHVGSLAENLLEALCTNPDVAKQIDAVRDFTRSEKKRLAMAMREKQLGQLGMRTNDKGQVTAKSNILQQIEELGDESGLVCCICREGYEYQATKVLGLYTFTKRCNVDEFEAKPRKTVGYSTVSHFNIVHIDCHMSAVRLARARDEWESAALQNANTKCNGLLPLWGPQVPESSFASCLARHNTYLQESTNHRDIGHNSTIHDLKILILKFAQEKSFHEDTGGGGPQSNMHLIPYLIHVALYVINTTRVNKREEANLMLYLETTNVEKWIESSYDAEGPLYWATMSILLHSQQQWQMHRLSHLRRLIILAHARHCQPIGPVKTLSDKTVKDYAVYKPYLIFFGIIDGIYNYFFKTVSGPDEQWSNNLADYIRHNDEALMKSSEKLLAAYTDEFLPCTSFSEFCDVTGLLDVITSPDTYISDLLNGIP
ncbi:E3 ubiquitin-protein ligase UBR4 isoform X2 [Diorhabda sublineata]|uniref:E3 ubiquitin-protein ligase UBR4 isoform X2 n=1 Tax=Diorhabda sublineata TaxID=1163346 RepID=UPI0024E0D624|nr:E3 ubiquitin-protein ligase UBR4 isoform X2 [Diorhabda sublineata]